MVEWYEETQFPSRRGDDGPWIRNHLPETFLATKEISITGRMVFTHFSSSSCCHYSSIIPLERLLRLCSLKGWHVLSRREDEFLVQVFSLPRRNGYRNSFFLSPLYGLFCTSAQSDGSKGRSPSRVGPSGPTVSITDRLLTVLHPGV